MEANTKKKLLYKQKPIAIRHADTDKGNRLYIAMVDDGDKDNTFMVEVHFSIPQDEAKDMKKFEPAQLLIRWMVEVDPNYIAVK